MATGVKTITSHFIIQVALIDLDISTCEIFGVFPRAERQGVAVLQAEKRLGCAHDEAFFCRHHWNLFGNGDPNVSEHG
jgi:hypothetical protein